MNPLKETLQQLARRQFLGSIGRVGIGAAALNSLMSSPAAAGLSLTQADESLAVNNGPGYSPGHTGPVHFPAKAKRVIYLCQSGAPSQIDTFDYKPSLDKLNGQDLPDSVRQGQRLTGMTARQKTFPAAKSVADFHQHGESGQWISDLLPHHHKIADEMCIINSVYTEAINHDPAITFFQTGSSTAGEAVGRRLGQLWVGFGER